MIPETATRGDATSNQQAPAQTVFVLMSESEGGVAGMVCATRQRAVDELRDVLSEYVPYDAGDSRPSYSTEAIEAFIEESRQASINPYREHWYWIDVCPVHI